MAKRGELCLLAVREAAKAYAWYARRSTAAAAGFSVQVRIALESIAERPESFPVHLFGTRRCLLKGYPYMLVFREALDRINVVAVAHGKRKPGYWRRRKP